MEGSTHPPLAQCMQQHTVLLPTLVAVEFIEQPVTLMEGAGILEREGERRRRKSRRRREEEEEEEEEEEHGHNNNFVMITKE